MYYASCKQIAGFSIPSFQKSSNCCSYLSLTVYGQIVFDQLILILVLFVDIMAGLACCPCSFQCCVVTFRIHSIGTHHHVTGSSNNTFGTIAPYVILDSTIHPDELGDYIRECRKTWIFPA